GESPPKIVRAGTYERSPQASRRSRGDVNGQGSIEQVRRKLHKIRSFGPDQGGANDSVGVKLLQYRPVGSELFDVGVRNFLDSTRWHAICLKVGNEYLGFGHRKAIDLTGDPQPFTERPYDRNFGSAAGRKTVSAVHGFEHTQYFLDQRVALIGR